MEEDCRIRKAIFSRKARETIEDLHFALPEQRLKAVKKLNCDHFGSNCWDYESTRFSQFTNSWRVLVRVALGMERNTHRYVVDALSNSMTSIKTDVLSRFIKFSKSLESSPSMEVRSMYRRVKDDRRSTTGNNLLYIEKLVGSCPNRMPYPILKAKLHEANTMKVPEGCEQVLVCIKELLEAKCLNPTKQEYKEIKENLYILGCT